MSQKKKVNNAGRQAACAAACVDNNDFATAGACVPSCLLRSAQGGQGSARRVRHTINFCYLDDPFCRPRRLPQVTTGHKCQIGLVWLSSYFESILALDLKNRLFVQILFEFFFHPFYKAFFQSPLIASKQTNYTHTYILASSNAFFKMQHAFELLNLKTNCATHRIRIV